MQEKDVLPYSTICRIEFGCKKEIVLFSDQHIGPIGHDRSAHAHRRFRSCHQRQKIERKKAIESTFFPRIDNGSKYHPHFTRSKVTARSAGPARMRNTICIGQGQKIILALLNPPIGGCALALSFTRQDLHSSVPIHGLQPLHSPICRMIIDPQQFGHWVALQQFAPTRHILPEILQFIPEGNDNAYGNILTVGFSGVPALGQSRICAPTQKAIGQNRQHTKDR